MDFKRMDSSRTCLCAQYRKNMQMKHLLITGMLFGMT